MADLGNLWFSLGLDDSKYEKQWQAAYNKYKQQANIDVRLAINNQDLNTIQNRMNTFMKGFNNNNAKAKIDIEVTPNTIQALQALRGMGGTKADWAVVKEAAKALREVSKTAVQAAKDQERLNNQINKGQKKVNANYNAQSLWLQNLSTLASNYFSLYAVKNFVTELAQVSGEFEKQRVTLQAMVGEMQGLEIYGKMKELSVVSPFEFKDLASYAKQLAAFSVPYEELYDTTKRLADVSAGLGVDMSRIILAYGQIRSAGVLRGTELRQLTEAGVPILEKLADKFEQLEGKAVSVGDVFGKISKKMVSFEMVKDIFTDLTSEGGKFYNMQEIQAETLSGKISNLKDAYSIMLSEIGGQTEGTLKRGVEWLYKMIDNWETVGTTVLSIASAFGVYQAAQAAAFAAEKLNLIRQFAKAFLDAGFNIKKAAESMAALNLATKGGVWGVILGVLAGIGTALYSAYQNANRFNKELDDIFNRQTTKLEQEARALEEIKDALEGATIGSQNRRDAINRFNSQFGPYLQNLLKETSTANELAIAYNTVADAIKNKNKQEAFTKAQSLVDDEYGSIVQTALSNIINKLNKENSVLGFDLDLATNVAAKIRNELEKTPDLTFAELKEILEKRFGEDIADRVSYMLYRVTDGSHHLFDVLKKDLKNYSSALTLAKKQAEAFVKTDNYSTKGEADLIERVNKLYDERLSKLREQSNLTQEEFDKQAKALESLKLQELAEGYGVMGLPKIAENYLKQWEQLTKITTGWRADIAKITASFNTDNIKVPTIFNPKDNETWLEYVKRIKDEYKDIKESISNLGSDPDKELPALEAQRKALEAVAKAYKIVLDAKGEAKTAKEKEKERVDALKEEYNWLLKVYDAYKKYREQGLADDNAKKSVLLDFADMPKSLAYAFEGEYDIEEWFQGMMGTLSREAAKGGSEIGIALGSAITRNLGVITSQEALNILKLKKDLEDELAKWGLEDFALSGEGVTLDISKILRDQVVADNQVAAKRDSLLKETEKLREKLGDEWYNKEVARINSLYNLEVGNNKKIAQEKINELARIAAEELMQNAGISKEFMSTLSDKTLKQLQEASDKLRGLAFGDINFSSDIEEQAQKAGVTLDQLRDTIRALLSQFEIEVDSESFDETKKKLSDSLDAAKKIVGAFKELDIEDTFFGSLLDTLDLGLGMASSLTEAFDRKDGKMTLVNPASLIDATAQLTTAIINQVAAAKQYREEMQRAADSFQQSIVSSRRELKIAGDEFETIFGENLVSAFEADSEAISDIVRELKNATSSVANMKIMTRKGFFGIGKQYTTLKDLAPQLFKADGSVNYEYLDEFLDAYGDKMSESQKILLENLKNSYEQYQDAMADTSDYLSGIFSDTASTIADRMLESFALTGNAATELGDLVGGVAKQMAKDLIQSLLVDQYLQPAMDRIKSLYNPQDKAFEEDSALRTQKAILTMQDAINAAGQAVPEVNKLLQAISDMGIDLTGDTKNASQVLSGLNEDQQNLLVSYINGIRADVSMNKGLLTSIVNSVGTINNNIATAIVVWKQIEANTHRSADGVDRIIGFFESVMGPYDGGNGQAFQVNIA